MTKKSQIRTLLLIGLVQLVHSNAQAQALEPKAELQNKIEMGPVQFINTKININTASLHDLTLLPGVGQVTAERILEYRAQNKFTRPEDLKKVKGIGVITFEKLKERIKI